MSHVRYVTTLLLSLSATFFIGASTHAAQDFSSSPLGQYISNNAEEFAEIEAFMAGLDDYAEQRRIEAQQQAQANPSQPGHLHIQRAMIACKDQADAFAAATDLRRSSPEVIARYNLAGSRCRTATNVLMPYLNEHPQAMKAWQQKMTPLLGTPAGVDMQALSSAYQISLEQRLANSSTSDTSAAVSNASDTALPPLPAPPYAFDWAEIDQLRAHIAAAMKQYNIDDLSHRSNSDKQQLQVCTDLLGAPKDIKLQYLALNEWMDSCAVLMARFSQNQYPVDLRKFGREYRSAYYQNEEQLQQAAVDTLPALPSQPYQLQIAEIEAFKAYMTIATGQSLNLQYAQQASVVGFNSNIEICGGTQTDHLKTDLTNPLIKSNWQGVVTRLQRCAKNISRQNKSAGLPLAAALDDYMQALQAVQSKSLF